MLKNQDDYFNFNIGDYVVFTTVKDDYQDGSIFFSHRIGVISGNKVKNKFPISPNGVDGIIIVNKKYINKIDWERKL